MPTLTDPNGFSRPFSDLSNENMSTSDAAVESDDVDELKSMLERSGLDESDAADIMASQTDEDTERSLEVIASHTHSCSLELPRHSFRSCTNRKLPLRSRAQASIELNRKLRELEASMAENTVVSPTPTEAQASRGGKPVVRWYQPCPPRFVYTRSGSSGRCHTATVNSN